MTFLHFYLEYYHVLKKILITLPFVRVNEFILCKVKL